MLKNFSRPSLVFWDGIKPRLFAHRHGFLDLSTLVQLVFFQNFFLHFEQIESYLDEQSEIQDAVFPISQRRLGMRPQDT